MLTPRKHDRMVAIHDQMLAALADQPLPGVPTKIEVPAMHLYLLATFAEIGAMTLTHRSERSDQAKEAIAAILDKLIGDCLEDLAEDAREISATAGSIATTTLQKLKQRD